jgi:hypothetical protein
VGLELSPSADKGHVDQDSSVIQSRLRQQDFAWMYVLHVHAEAFDHLVELRI